MSFFRRRIIIRAFTLRRDMGWAILLKKALERLGADVFIACSRNYVWAVQAWKPHVVIVNTVGQIGYSAKYAPTAEIVFWPAEGGEPWIHSDANLLSRSPELFTKISAVFAWGELGLEHFARAFPGSVRGKVFKFGNPRLDLIKFFSAPKRTQTVIGFATRFNSICHADGRPTLYTLTNPKNLGSVITQAKNFVGFYELVQLILRETDYVISVRPHPLESPTYYEQYIQRLSPSRILVDRSYDFLLWLANQSVLVTPTTSANIEAYIANATTVNLDSLSGTSSVMSDFNEHASFLGERFAISLSDHASVLDVLKRSIDGSRKPMDRDPMMDEFLKRAHDWPRDYSSILRGAEKVIEIALENNGPPLLWPTLPLLQLKDQYDVRHLSRADPLHLESNYSAKYHKIGKVYDEIFSRMLLSQRPI